MPLALLIVSYAALLGCRLPVNRHRVRRAIARVQKPIVVFQSQMHDVGLWNVVIRFEVHFDVELSIAGARQGAVELA